MFELSVDELVEGARSKAQLQDFGDESFRVALSVLVDSINVESGLTDIARTRQGAELTGALVSRLRVQEFLRQNPEVESERIASPVVIVGLQRTGTSKLFRVIASDPQWNKLLTWQVLNPVPLQDELKPGETDPRITVAEEFAANWTRAGGQAAHSIEAHAPEMEHPLLAKSFVTPSPGLLVPTHQRWCETADYRPAYRYLKTQIQAVQWQSPQQSHARWILKTPFHLHNLPTLVETFPDAKLVMTHRHPRSSVGSMLRLVELLQQASAEHVDRELIGVVWLRILSLGIQRSLEFRDARGEDSFHDVAFRDVVDDIGTVIRGVYEYADAPFSRATQEQIRRSELDNPQNKDGKHTYDFRDYGISEADIDDAFRDYLERFGHLF